MYVVVYKQVTQLYNVLVMWLVLGQSLMVISTTGILLYAKVSPIFSLFNCTHTLSTTVNYVSLVKEPISFHSDSPLTKCLTITIFDDNITERDGEFFAMIESPSDLVTTGRSSATIFILNDDGSFTPQHNEMQ